MLPSNYSDILSAGVQALRRIETDLRRRAEREPNAPELWLAVRDVGGLAGRIGDYDDWEWQTGVAHSLISPADLGVLSRLGGPTSEDSPYRDDAISSLLDFLTRYTSGEFKLEDADSYRSTDHPGAR